MSTIFPLPHSDRTFGPYTASVGQTDFSGAFGLQDDNDVVVSRTRGGTTTDLVLDVDYEVVGTGSADGFTVRLTSGALAGDIISGKGLAVIERLTSVVQAGQFNSRQLDKEMDRSRIIDMELRRDVDEAHADIAALQAADTGLQNAIDVLDIRADANDLTNILQDTRLTILEGRNDDFAAAAGFRDFQTFEALLADTSLTYTGSLPGSVTYNDTIRTRREGFIYTVALAIAVDQHVTTAGGMKLYVAADPAGYHVDAFGAALGGEVNAAISKALAVSVSQRKPLNFADRTYTASASVFAVTLVAGASLVINGNGAVIDTTIADAGAAYDGYLSVSGDATNKLFIRDLNITSSQAGAVSTARARGNMVGLAVQSIGTVQLDNVNVSGFGFINIWLYNADRACVTNCSGINARYAGLLMQSCLDTLIIGGKFNQNGGNNSGVVEGYGVTAATRKNGGDRDNSNVSIFHVTANDNVGKGIDAHDSLGFTVTKCNVKGFIYAGIYAVNEGGSKNVSDVSIVDNDIDGAGGLATAASAVGIDIGASGAASYSGSFTVSKNRVRNIANSTANNMGVFVRNPASGVAPLCVSITANTFIDAGKAGSSTAAVIQTNNAAIALGEIVVTSNIIQQTVSCTQGIRIGPCARQIVGLNIITTSASFVQGIYPYSAAPGVIDGNILNGTFTSVDFGFFGLAGLIYRSNISNGAPFKDVFTTGISIAFGTAPPVSGTHFKGSIVHNSDYAAGQPRFWICTATGTPGTWIADVLIATLVHDAPSIAAGAVYSFDVNVPGATINMSAVAVSNGFDANLEIFARPSAPNTVKVFVRNMSGGAIDPVNATYTVRVFP